MRFGTAKEIMMNESLLERMIISYDVDKEIEIKGEGMREGKYQISYQYTHDECGEEMIGCEYCGEWKYEDDLGMYIPKEKPGSLIYVCRECINTKYTERRSDE